MNCDNWVLTIRPKKVTKEEIRKCSCFTVERPAVYPRYSSPTRAYYPYGAQAPQAQTYPAILRSSTYSNKPQNQSIEDEEIVTNQGSPLGRPEQSTMYTNTSSSSGSGEYQPNGTVYGNPGGPLSSESYLRGRGPLYGNRRGPVDSEPYQPNGPVHVYPESSSIPKFLYGLMGRRRR